MRGVLDEAIQLDGELVDHADVERAEVCAEGLVDELLVDAEVIRIGLVPRGRAVAQPEKLVWDDLDRSILAIHVYVEYVKVVNY